MTPFGVDKKSFGQRIRSLRTLNKWTQEQLGRRTNLNSELIRAYEAGKAFPKPEGLVSLASILSVPIEWLLTGVGDIQLSTATKERTPVEEMIAETQATISRNITAWGVRWKWLDLFDQFIGDRDLMHELQPDIDELMSIRDALANGELDTKEEIVAFLVDKVRQSS